MIVELPFFSIAYCFWKIPGNIEVLSDPKEEVKNL